MINFQSDDTVGYVYQQVADHVAARIEAGELRPGRPLPAEHRMKEEYGVSLGTVRHALRLLRFRGLVFTKPSGTYVVRREPNTAPDDVLAEPKDENHVAST
ncbi:winged helix-turn-helix transcriptional regulator [Amycolatopsis acidicola]|uniref:Winged helix-turn-helix transcriptional regulator n=1 Tax=Amycolatopsis acidicola TaxID=2596893 RepID=A0A5N0UZL5_9PSEU|nr:winged helix-turn-helix domain-containing protein [Amycolatopsis acidicola]KAA9159420.1 winged helix-turn-helix transcriptional regulator [Amycolatopsis acidicola]